MMETTLTLTFKYCRMRDFSLFSAIHLQTLPKDARKPSQAQLTLQRSQNGFILFPFWGQGTINFHVTVTFHIPTFWEGGKKNYISLSINQSE